MNNKVTFQLWNKSIYLFSDFIKCTNLNMMCYNGFNLTESIDNIIMNEVAKFKLHCKSLITDNKTVFFN